MDVSGGSEEHQKRVVFGIMRYLQGQLTSGKLSEDGAESLGVALDCISQVYQLDVENRDHVAAYGIDKSLEELFPVAAPKVASSTQKQAEGFKTQGNAHLKNGDVDKAVECYSKAIELDPTNATYFCNRAAGLIKQKKLQQALEDCQQAIMLNPDYARAHGRMGYVYSNQGQYAEAKKCFLEATRLDPENQSYKENLATVEQQLKSPPQTGQQASGAASGAGASAGAMPGGGIPGLGGMNLGNMLNNPAFMNMASSLMSQPGFQQMASSMMGNMAGGGGGGGGGGGAGEGMMPQVAQMAQDMQQNNPELFQSLQQQAQGLAAQSQQNQQNPSQQ